MELETAASTIEVTEAGVVIRWSDGSRSRFHTLWLRDNDSSTFSLTELNPDLFVLLAERNDDGDLMVEFSDGHESVFDFDQLRDNSYEPHDRRGKPSITEHFRAGHTLDEFDFPASGSAQHCDLLDSVALWGAAIVNNVPGDESAITAMATLVGRAPGAHVGQHRELVVEADDLEPGEAPPALDPHTDEPYWYVPSGISILQCVEVSTTGGDAILVDGFGIAADLQDDDPDTFDLLCQVSVPFVLRTFGAIENGEDSHLVAHAPVISLDRDYEISGVRFNETSLAPLDVDPGRMGDYYQALIQFAKCVNDPGRAIQIGLQPGQVLIYDNHRILHGRTTFGSGGGRRHLRLDAVERDRFHSRLRRLRAIHNRPDVDERFPNGSIG